MKMRRARLLLFVAVLVVGAALVARAVRTAPAATPAHRPAAGHGGQLVAAVHADPRSFNRYVAADQTTDLITQLTQGTLVRVNRVTFELEPWLADRWESSDDGRTHVLHLRDTAVWSDGVPLTAADVVFSFAAVFDQRTGSGLADTLTIGGHPIQAAARDEHTVVITFPAPSGPGLRILDNLPILPEHKLGPALAAGTFHGEWTTRTPVADMVGTGPFRISDYQPGQRVVLTRNERYWRKAPDGSRLPRLERLILDVISDQETELLRLRAGAIDIPQDALRPEDVVTARSAEREGRLKVVPVGIAADADAFWFCLKPAAKKGDPRFAFVQQAAFRQAIAHAVDRREFANVVYLGEAEPIWGPVTPANRRWFTDVRHYEYDPGRAVALLKSIGLEDRDGNGIVEDAHGVEARFTVLTQRGVTAYERGTTVLRESAARIGIALDVVPLEFGAMVQRMLASKYDAIYMHPVITDMDPGMNLDLWLSSGGAHFWNLQSAAPATPWEKEIDTLMTQQATTLEEPRRRELFARAQGILADNVPVLSFAAPRLSIAHSTRVLNVKPSPLRPTVLWNADMLSVSGE